MVRQTFPACLVALMLLSAGSPALATPPASKPCSPRECLAAEVDALRVVEAARRDGVQILDLVGKAVPELLWLENLTWRQGKLLLEGKAFNTNAIANFIDALDSAEELSSPTLVDTTEVGTETYRFKISAERNRKTGTTAGEASTGDEDEQALRAERTRLLKGIRKRSEVPDTLDSLQSIMDESGAEVEAFQPADLSSLTSIDALPVRIQLSNTTFHDLALLFDRLSRFPTFVFLTDLVIRSAPDGPGTITAAFTLKIPTLDSPASKAP